jgi:hypothetical protein
MAAELQRLGAISDRHASTRESIIVQLVKLLLGIWGDFSDARDDVASISNAARSATLVMSAASRMRLQSRSHLQSLFTAAGERATLPRAANPYPRSGVSALEVYQRPGRQFVWQLSQGSSVAEARQAAETRLQSIAQEDLSLADRDESRRVFEENRKKVLGYRRVIHPELSEDGTCGLCLVASQRFYSVEDLLDIHQPVENCTVMPIFKGDDPGLRLNDDDLKTIYAAAGSTHAEDLLNTRISVREHGELGPVLVKQGDHFRTAKEAGRPEYVKPTPDSVRAANRKARDEAAAKLTAFSDELTPLLDDTSREAAARRATLTQATKNLRAYIDALDTAFRTLQ